MALAEWLSRLDEGGPSAVRCTGPDGVSAIAEHGEPVTACICSAADGGGETPAALVAGPFGLRGALSVTAVRVLFVGSAGAAAHLGSFWPLALAVALVAWWEASKMLRHPAFRPARAFLLSTLTVAVVFFGDPRVLPATPWSWGSVPMLMGLGVLGAGLTSMALATRQGWAGALQVLPAWAATASVLLWWRPGLVLLLVASALATRALVAAGLAHVGPVSRERFALRARPALRLPRRRLGHGVTAILMPLAHLAARFATDAANQALRVAWQALGGGLWLANQAAWTVETLARKCRVFASEARRVAVASARGLWEGSRVFLLRLVPGAAAAGVLGWSCVWTSRRVHGYLLEAPDGSFLAVCAGSAATVLATALAVAVVGRLSVELVARGLRDLWELDLTQYLLALWVTSVMLSVGVPSLAEHQLVLPSPLRAPFLWLMTLGVVLALLAYWRHGESTSPMPRTDRTPLPVPPAEPAALPAWPGAVAAVVFVAVFWIIRLS
jgi:hypothetical protein